MSPRPRCWWITRRDPVSVGERRTRSGRAVSENARTGARRTMGTTEFRQEQLAAAQGRLEAGEGQISAFKAQHSGELPEQQGVALGALERLNAQVLVIVGRRDALTRQL